MIAVEPERWRELRPLFLPERPGPNVGLHAVLTGLGSCHADRLENARVAVAQVGANIEIAGDPAALRTRDLESLELRGFIHADASLLPLLERYFADLRSSALVVSRLRGTRVPAPSAEVSIRRLGGEDLPAIERIDPSLRWIWNTLEGAAGLAAFGHAWGAFVDGRLASIATPFTIGERYEELGVVTEPALRGRGLSPACVARLIEDVRGRGREPSWTTTPDNHASLRVAERLGALKVRDDVQYLTGIEWPD